MRFGMFIPQGWRLDLVDIPPEEQWNTMLGIAKRADQGTAFETVFVYDHFHTVPEPTSEATHEAWTLMAAFAAATERVRLGQMCTCMAYRNPAYLAKVAATVDIISGGRAEMGIGAGWYEHEWRAYGYGFPRAGERLAMLDEGVQIMRQLWTHGTATLKGEHYSVDGAICRPLPLQEGGIPLWIAGGGEKVTLRIAAKNARGGELDAESYTGYTNFGGDLDTFVRKSEILAQHCRDLGTDFDSITRTSSFNIVIGETEAEVEDKLSKFADVARRFLPADRVEEALKNYRTSPTTGTPEQITEHLEAMRDAGMKYAIFYVQGAAYESDSLDLVEQKVIPALQ
ncbi:TIGR03560 family F420-dependent LLM class oxidoreductase [Phytoactinopolyspora mesophila]|uniref:TIGR03560 family F420-dependent LLM class oxidoreductase n=1 Tax=Phytoactinopolyspora mesophila TaxID=2650750 RepID=A0A7K3M312_9ACTN|nr:TIGR03560 family F420-dependent LLM class oxidoreductase [Phytoactinopolyspora mesophila]